MQRVYCVLLWCEDKEEISAEPVGAAARDLLMRKIIQPKIKIIFTSVAMLSFSSVLCQVCILSVCL